MLRIYNTLTREKAELVPLEPGKVRMYVCGVTSYAPSHVGHARTFVAFDVVYRWLKKRSAVTFARNFTDIDDKIINAARAAGEDPVALSLRNIDSFTRDMTALRCLRPSIEPRVTEHIPEIVQLIERLVASGFGYPVDGDVYYDVMRFPAYGRLSGRTLADLSDLEAGARVEVDNRKRSPYDFALWKSAKPGEPSWSSPWGKGRPGWHIECSAMSEKYLGETFDIHGGGKDLIFPHHENELAQSSAASGKPEMARVWMHTGFVNLLPEKCPKCEADIAAPDGAPAPSGCGSCGYVFTEAELKMSKSRGNFYPIQEVISAFEPEALRLLLSSSHYRSPIAFSHKLLADHERRLDKIYETLSSLDKATAIGEQTIVPGPSFAEVFGVDPRAKFEEAMDDDFNAALAIADLAQIFPIANDLIAGREKERIGRSLMQADRLRLLGEIRHLARELGGTLGLFEEHPDTYLARRKAAASKTLAIGAEEIDRLIAERNEARSNKNWKRSDEIRDELKAKRILLKDGKDGTSWEVLES